MKYKAITFSHYSQYFVLIHRRFFSLIEDNHVERLNYVLTVERNT